VRLLQRAGEVQADMTEKLHVRPVKMEAWF